MTLGESAERKPVREKSSTQITDSDPLNLVLGSQGASNYLKGLFKLKNELFPELEIGSRMPTAYRECHTANWNHIGFDHLL